MRLARSAAPLFLLALAACASNSAAPSASSTAVVGTEPATPATAAPPTAWKGGIAKKLVIIGINDTHGGILAQEPSKGLAKMGIDKVGGAEWFSGWVNAVRADAAEKGADVIILDGGDMFQGTLISNQFRGASVVDVYNSIGVTAAAIGNHEFDFGMPVLKDRMAQAHFPILSANIFLKGTDTRPDWAKPYAIVQAAGTKVGIIGLSTMETPTTTNPINIADVEFRPGGPIAAKLADELRAQGCTIVLITGHIGPKSGNAGGEREVQHVADLVQGKVDAIVSGHHHERIGPPPLIDGNIPIIQSGAKLVAFSTIELTLNSTGHTVSFAVNDGNWPRSGGPQDLIHSLDGAPPRYRGHEVFADPKIAAILKGYDDQVSKAREQVIGKSEVKLAKMGEDELLANLCADSLRSGAGGSLKADFAFQNTGGIRVQEIPPGPITFGQIFDLYPFDNQQVVITLPMATVRDALEAILHAGKPPMRVAGMTYTVDWNKFGANKDLRHAPPGALVTEVDDEAGKPLCMTKSCTANECVSDCRAGNFTLSVTDFLANGGDGLTLLADKNLVKSIGPIGSRESIVAYVKERSPLTAKSLGAPSAGAPPRIRVIGSSGTE